MFPIFGDGRYRMRPIHVDDLARLAVEQGAEPGSRVIDAVGPESFAYRELVRTIGRLIGWRRLLVGVPPGIGYLGAAGLGRMMGDVMLTRDEVRGLMTDLLYVDSPATGETGLTDWISEHADQLGRRYASELARRKDRERAYS